MWQSIDQQQNNFGQKKKNVVYHDFFKTKLCPLFLEGKCNKGQSCNFAHDESEIREQPNLFKTRMCEQFVKGMCNNGEYCKFAHGEHELRSTPDLFKTAVCIPWTKGKCMSGDRCRYAHGQDDLRPAPSRIKKFSKEMNYPKQFGLNANMQRFPYQNNFNQNYNQIQMSPIYHDQLKQSAQQIRQDMFYPDYYNSNDQYQGYGNIGNQYDQSGGFYNQLNFDQNNVFLQQNPEYYLNQGFGYGQEQPNVSNRFLNGAQFLSQ